MVKNNELSLKKIKKFVSVFLIVTILTSVSTLLSAATVAKTVNISENGNVTILKTTESTVQGVLTQAGISLQAEDKIIPALDAEMYEGMNIEVIRAKNMLVYINGSEGNKKIAARNVGEVLDAYGISLGNGDLVSPALDVKAYNGIAITVIKAIPVTLSVYGYVQNVYTQAKTVSQLLHAQGVVLTEEDKLDVPAETQLVPGMVINVIKMGKNYVDVVESIPFGTDVRYTTELSRGESRKICDGIAGEQISTYVVNYENGNEVSREFAGRVVIREPINEIVEYGTTDMVVTSRGENIRAVKTLDVVATAYDLSYESCGKRPGDRGYGITASGLKAEYGVIAVDRSVIPLGTRLYVEAVDGSWTYGYCIAGDTGGGIKGNRIDLFYNTKQEAVNFGVKKARVYVLE